MRQAARDSVRNLAQQGSGAVADQTSPVKDIRAAAQQVRAQQGTRLDAAKVAAAEGARTAAAGAVSSSTGLPPSVSKELVKVAEKSKQVQAAKRAAKAATRVGAGVVGLILILVLSLLAGTLSADPPRAPQPSHPDRGDTPIPPDIPIAFFDAYWAAANQHRVPWTLLAAIGKTTTDHGRRSPYDEIDRDPDRSPPAVMAPGTEPAPDAGTGSRWDDANCPSVDPQIGGAAAGQGEGPMLVRPDALTHPGGDLPAIDVDDTANICETADAVAERLYALAQDHADANDLDYGRDILQVELGSDDQPDVGQLATIDAFWSAVIDESGLIADPTSPQTGCGVPTDATVAATIQIVWRCELRPHAPNLKVVTAADTAADGTITWRTATGDVAVAQLVNEALAVAAARGALTNDYRCDPNDGGSGVFGLSATQRTDHQVTDPCDVVANVRAAARIVGAAETTAPETRSNAAGPYAPMQGGWRQLPDALGTPEVAAAFATSGPWVPWAPTEECRAVLNDWLTERIVTADNNPFTSPPPADGPARSSWLADAAAWFDAAPTDATLDPRCVTADGTTVDDRRFTVAAAHQAREIQSQFDEAHHSDDEDALGAVLDQIATGVVATRVADYLTLRAEELANTEAPQGALLRLTTNGRAVPVVVPPAGGAGGTPNSVAPLIIQQAIAYGGIAAGDQRTSTGSGGVGAAVSLALDGPDLAAQYPLIQDSRTDPNATPLTCGTPGAWLHRDMATLWERMCADALAAGTNPGGWGGRSHADQIRLRSTNGCPDTWTASPSRCRVPTAIPGRSNHERGVALDLANLSGNPAFRHFVHDIVGCYTRRTNTYVPYSNPVDYELYATAIDTGADTVTDTAGTDVKRCATSDIPVKRVNTYGMVLGVCTDRGEDQQTAQKLRCQGKLEDWHIEPGVPLLTIGALTGGGPGQDCFYNPQNPLQVGDLTINPNDAQTVAQATYSIFFCEARAAGLEALPPTPYANGTGPQVFTNKAQQVAAEAVVVAYCESGYDAKNMSSNNRHGFGGVFQFGDAETARWIPGGNKFDIAANITGGARYFLAGHGKGRWDGWGPWAVINTDYGGPNEKVDFPVLPRFTSTEPGFEGRRIAGALPAWAIDPFTSALNGASCHAAFSAGTGW